MNIVSLFQRDWQQTYRVMTSPFRSVPDFIIAGEAKCGTTSLYRYIVSHPNVRAADKKEPNNFIVYPDSMAMCRSHYAFKQIGWWQKTIINRDSITGEASAEYFSRRYVAEKISKNLPGVKIIILLRDPVQRALSDWNMLHDAGILNDSFEEIVEKGIRWLQDTELRPILDDAGQLEHSAIRVVLRGIYVDNLKRWMKHFDNNQLRVYTSEKLLNNPQSITEDVYRFIEIDPYTLSDQKQYRKGSYDTGTYTETLKTLSDFYAPFNEDLYQVLGYRLPWGGESVS